MATDPKCFVERAIVLAKVTGVYEDKPRRCVVLRVEADVIEVAYGQGTRGSDRDVAVMLGTPDGRRYQVDKDTFFRPTNIAIIPRADVIRHLGTASREHLVTFQEFSQARSLAAAPVVAAPVVSRAPTPKQATTNPTATQPQKPQQQQARASKPDDES